MTMSKIYRLFAVCCFAWGTFAYAAPDADDPIANLIQQKQTEQDILDQAGLDKLLNEKTKENSTHQQAIHKPAVTSHQATPPPVAHNNKNDADELISSAMGFLGVAYRFGGTTPTGFDCSGFMQYIFRKAFSVNLPRTSAEQATVGIYVSRSELQPGDMVFFRTSGNRISHVGMYIGNDRFIHAPRTGKRIEITSLSSQYWSSKYATARRVKRNNAQNFIRN